MTIHDFTSGKRIRKEDNEILLYNKIYGTVPGIKNHDIVLLNYKRRKTSNLIIDIEYSETKKNKTSRFTAIIIFLEFLS